VNKLKALLNILHCTQHGTWSFLIDEAIKDMIADLKTYSSHDYIVKDDKIGYKEQDGISFKVTDGYKTLFAYFHENNQNNISKKSLDDYINITIRCGAFSYAELPHRFVNIIRVTGTLEHLSSAEKEVMKDSYFIDTETYMPSVYGENKGTFALNADIKIENKDDYFMTICNEITSRLAGTTVGTQRAVLVFFENQKKLEEFKNSSVIRPISEYINIITEEANETEKRQLMKKASRAGQITLLTCTFGRGTDFYFIQSISK